MCYTIIRKGENNRKEPKMSIYELMEKYELTREEVEEVLFS